MAALAALAGYTGIGQQKQIPRARPEQIRIPGGGRSTGGRSSGGAGSRYSGREAQREMENQLALAKLMLPIRMAEREQIQQLEFGKMREEAKIQASQFEYEYGVQAKRKLAEYNRAIQWAKTSPDVDEEDRQGLVMQLEAAASGVPQDMIPKRKKPEDFLPPGRKMNIPYDDPDTGARIVHEEGSRGQIVTRVLLEPSKTAKGQQMAMEAKRYDNLLMLSERLAGQTLTTGSGLEETKRPRTPEEAVSGAISIMEALDARMRNPAPPVATERNWSNDLSQRKIPTATAVVVLPEDLRRAPEVGEAAAVYRTLIRKYGDLSKITDPVKASEALAKMGPQDGPAFFKAVSILSAYQKNYSGR